MTVPSILKPSSKEFNQQVFFIGLFIIILFQIAGLLLHYATENRPGFLASLGISLLLILMAKSFGDKFNRKKTFVLAGIIAFLGCFISARIIIDFKDYLEISHVVGVSVDDLMNDPKKYDYVKLFYLEDAIIRSDIYGLNEIRVGEKDSVMTTYAVYPIVPVRQIGAEIRRIGAWMVADMFINSPIKIGGYVGNRGAMRVDDERETMYRAAIENAQAIFGVESDWNAPILEIGTQDNRFATPRQFFWVMFNLLIWPVIWIVLKITHITG